MTISYQDFLPRITDESLFFREHELLSDTVARANEWIAAWNVKVINVETVLLPNVDGPVDASRTALRTSGRVSSHWYQIVRVWHQVVTPAAG